MGWAELSGEAGSDCAARTNMRRIGCHRAPSILTIQSMNNLAQ
jgi:hypothetical protein